MALMLSHTHSPPGRGGRMQRVLLLSAEAATRKADARSAVGAADLSPRSNAHMGSDRHRGEAARRLTGQHK